MKIVIDIPEKVYQEFKDGVGSMENTTIIHNAVYDGTVLPKEYGRLIDADELKKDFKDRLEKAKNWKENALNRGDEEIVIRADATINFICEVIMTINIAPTVNKCDNCDLMFMKKTRGEAE